MWPFSKSPTVSNDHVQAALWLTTATMEDIGDIAGVRLPELTAEIARSYKARIRWTRLVVRRIRKSGSAKQ